MYSPGHFIFIVISLILVAFGVFMVRTRRPSIEQLIRFCLPIAIVCEVIKILLVIEVLPVVEPAVVDGALAYAETGAYSPHIKVEDLPFELCSLQIVFMFLALVVKSAEGRRRLYSLIYGTALAGGLLALFLSSIAPKYDSTLAFLTSPRAWEFFVYHAMIIVVALSIALDRDTCDLRFKDVAWMAGTVVFLDVLSLYLNSLLAIEVYRDGILIGLEHATNFFSSFNNPLGIPMPDKLSYFTYLAIRYVVGSLIIVLMYVPFLKRGRKEQSEEA